MNEEQFQCSVLHSEQFIQCCYTLQFLNVTETVMQSELQKENFPNYAWGKLFYPFDSSTLSNE